MRTRAEGALVRRAATEAHGIVLPAVVAWAGERAERRFIEFFTANIRNPNTRAAYARAVGHFVASLEERHVTLDHVEPVMVAEYIGQLGRTKSAPTVKQSLAAFSTGDLDPNDDGAWNDYLGTLDQMGLATYVETYQAAYDAKNGG